MQPNTCCVRLGRVSVIAKYASRVPPNPISTLFKRLNKSVTSVILSESVSGESVPSWAVWAHACVDKKLRVCWSTPRFFQMVEKTGHPKKCACLFWTICEECRMLLLAEPGEILQWPTYRPNWFNPDWWLSVTWEGLKSEPSLLWGVTNVAPWHDLHYP